MIRDEFNIFNYLPTDPEAEHSMIVSGLDNFKGTCNFLLHAINLPGRVLGPASLGSATKKL